MNNSNHDDRPNENGPELEQRLKSLRWKPASAAQRDSVLYQCGHAAGMAEARAQFSHQSRLWRRLAIAASVLACFSLAPYVSSLSQYASRSTTNVSQNSHATQEPSNDGHQASSSLTAFWMAAQERRSTANDLRASSSFIESRRHTPSDYRSLEPIQNSETLQPRDLSLFLQGGA